jgi:hypothetical protein
LRPARNRLGGGFDLLFYVYRLTARRMDGFSTFGDLINETFETGSIIGLTRLGVPGMDTSMTQDH